MSLALMAFLAVLIASIPLFISTSRRLFNPALYVLVIIAWSVLGKTLYIWLLRPEPAAIGKDAVYVDASSMSFLLVGEVAVLVAVLGYLVGYIVPRDTVFPNALTISRNWRIPERGIGIVLVLAFLSIASFGIYLELSGNSFFDGPFSKKRFSPVATGVLSRFQYFPYYFFKLAITIASITYVATVLLVQSTSKRLERWNHAIVFVLYLCTLIFAHFASLRLFILLLFTQVCLLLYLRGKGRMLFVGSLAAVTALSFVMITFVHRSQPVPVTISDLTSLQERFPGANLPRKSAEIEAISEPGIESSTKEATGSDAGLPRKPAENEATSKPAIESSTKEVTGSDADLPRKPAEVEAISEPGIESSTKEATGLDERNLRGTAAEKIAPGLDPSSVEIGPLRRLGAAAFAGRYFMDVAKLAHIVGHFPSEHPYLLGGSLAIRIPEASTSPVPAGYEEIGLERYLARRVFDEPRNHIPAGYAGDLYVNFGWIGLLMGFAVLGALHRLLYNHVSLPRLPAVFAGLLIILLVSSTLVLLNSGIKGALSRTIVDFAVLVLVWKLAVVLERHRGAPERERTESS